MHPKGLRKIQTFDPSRSSVATDSATGTGSGGGSPQQSGGDCQQGAGGGALQARAQLQHSISIVVDSAGGPYTQTLGCRQVSGDDKDHLMASGACSSGGSNKTGNNKWAAADSKQQPKHHKQDTTGILPVASTDSAGAGAGDVDNNTPAADNCDNYIDDNKDDDGNNNDSDDDDEVETSCFSSELARRVVVVDEADRILRSRAKSAEPRLDAADTERLREHHIDGRRARAASTAAMVAACSPPFQPAPVASAAMGELEPPLLTVSGSTQSRPRQRHSVSGECELAPQVQQQQPQQQHLRTEAQSTSQKQPPPIPPRHTLVPQVKTPVPATAAVIPIGSSRLEKQIIDLGPSAAVGARREQRGKSFAGIRGFLGVGGGGGGNELAEHGELSKLGMRRNTHHHVSFGGATVAGNGADIDPEQELPSTSRSSLRNESIVAQAPSSTASLLSSLSPLSTGVSVSRSSFEQVDSAGATPIFASRASVGAIQFSVSKNNNTGNHQVRTGTLHQRRASSSIGSYSGTCGSSASPPTIGTTSTGTAGCRLITATSVDKFPATQISPIHRNHSRHLRRQSLQVAGHCATKLHCAAYEASSKSLTEEEFRGEREFNKQVRSSSKSPELILPTVAAAVAGESPAVTKPFRFRQASAASPVSGTGRRSVDLSAARTLDSDSLHPAEAPTTDRLIRLSVGNIAAHHQQPTRHRALSVIERVNCWEEQQAGNRLGSKQLTTHYSGRHQHRVSFGNIDPIASAIAESSQSTEEQGAGANGGSNSFDTDSAEITCKSLTSEQHAAGRRSAAEDRQHRQHREQRQGEHQQTQTDYTAARHFADDANGDIDSQSEGHSQRDRVKSSFKFNQIKFESCSRESAENLETNETPISRAPQSSTRVDTGAGYCTVDSTTIDSDRAVTNDPLMTSLPGTTTATASTAKTDTTDGKREDMTNMMNSASSADCKVEAVAASADIATVDGANSAQSASAGK